MELTKEILQEIGEEELRMQRENIRVKSRVFNFSFTKREDFSKFGKDVTLKDVADEKRTETQYVETRAVFNETESELNKLADFVKTKVGGSYKSVEFDLAQKKLICKKEVKEEKLVPVEPTIEHRSLTDEEFAQLYIEEDDYMKNHYLYDTFDSNLASNITHRGMDRFGSEFLRVVDAREDKYVNYSDYALLKLALQSIKERIVNDDYARGGAQKVGYENEPFSEWFSTFGFNKDKKNNYYIGVLSKVTSSPTDLRNIMRCYYINENKASEIISKIAQTVNMSDSEIEDDRYTGYEDMLELKDKITFDPYIDGFFVEMLLSWKDWIFEGFPTNQGFHYGKTLSDVLNLYKDYDNYEQRKKCIYKFYVLHGLFEGNTDKWEKRKKEYENVTIQHEPKKVVTTKEVIDEVNVLEYKEKYLDSLPKTRVPVEIEVVVEDNKNSSSKFIIKSLNYVFSYQNTFFSLIDYCFIRRAKDLKIALYYQGKKVYDLVSSNNYSKSYNLANIKRDNVLFDSVVFKGKDVSFRQGSEIALQLIVNQVSII